MQKAFCSPNPEYLEIAIHPEFNKITVKKIDGSNRKLLKKTKIGTAGCQCKLSERKRR